MRYISSGYSHGKQITIILEGIPSNVFLDLDEINEALRERQLGYGRGGRMKIESDKAEILSGVLFGKTTGAPMTIVVKNKDYINHQSYMDPFTYDVQDYQKVEIPRPGHADLVGAIKYNQDDMRCVFERASARETVSRVVVGAICLQILRQLGISVISYVTNIGGITLDDDFDLSYLEQSEVRMPSQKSSVMVKRLIDEAKIKKDTLGGICQVEVTNVPAGLGSYVSHETKLDAKIAASVLSIQSCKGIEFGDGFSLGDHFGSEVHDEIVYHNGFTRTSNHYGGFEGGMTTGMPIVLKAVFKPIPTLMKPLQSVHIKSKEAVLSHIERSDVCVVPSASIICMYTVVYEIAKAIFEQFTSDTMEQLKEALTSYREYVKQF
ncbi:chorismate synthase [Mycoplasmatota bacterium]|nr:chorismate synthase [Mycoplasmatota bacterium]